MPGLKKSAGISRLRQGARCFLVKIAEIPLNAAKPKLLRVLESKGFRRLGGLRTAKLDHAAWVAGYQQEPARGGEGGAPFPPQDLYLPPST